MKTYVAYVTDKESGKKAIIKRVYETKKAFYQDLRGNGYSVAYIALESEFDAVSEKYHEKLELQKRIRQVKKQMKKSGNESNG